MARNLGCGEDVEARLFLATLRVLTTIFLFSPLPDPAPVLPRGAHFRRPPIRRSSSRFPSRTPGGAEVSLPLPFLNPPRRRSHLGRRHSSDSCCSRTVLRAGCEGERVVYFGKALMGMAAAAAEGEEEEEEEEGRREPEAAPADAAAAGAASASTARER